MTPTLALAVVLTGAVAAVARFSIAVVFAARHHQWAVLAVNVAGSAVGGTILALAERAEVSADLRLVLLTGLCGGLTTFSTFSVETVQMFEAGRVRLAVGNVAANLVLGVGAAALGYLLLR